MESYESKKNVSELEDPNHLPGILERTRSSVTEVESYESKENVPELEDPNHLPGVSESTRNSVTEVERYESKPNTTISIKGKTEKKNKKLDKAVTKIKLQI